MKKIILSLALILSTTALRATSAEPQSALAASTEPQQADTLANNDAAVQQTPKNTTFNYNTLDLGDFGAIKLSGYVQAQWQHSSYEGSLMSHEPESYPLNSDNRFMIRRARLKFAYKKDFFTAVLQLNLSPTSVGAVDAYVGAETNDGMFGGQVGLFDIPFSYEVSYSSSKLESIERSRVMMSLFPGEKDLGAQINFEHKGFEFKGGLFNGTGIDKENDSRKNFIGKLSYTTEFEGVEVGGILSYYNGGEVNPTDEHYVYRSGVGFEKVANEAFSHSLKQYFGVGAKFQQNNWGIGRTNFMAEAVWGNQPGTLNLNNNEKGGYYPDYGEIPLFEREFFGAYAMLAQTIGDSKHTAVLKWDYYDPNIHIAGNEIGKLDNTGVADIAYTTIGVGYIFNWTKNLKLTAYYNYVINEQTNYVAGFMNKTDENVLTLRMQVTF